MQMIESNRTQLISLSLPSSALVVDMRGVSKDDVMKRLEIEIADLAAEMKTQDIHHWRYLTEFLSCQTLDPMSVEEVNILRKANQSNTQSGSLPSSVALAGTAQKGLTGGIPSTSEYSSPFFFMDSVASLAENRPAEVLTQKIHHLILEIDRLRNNRHVAVADVERTMSGRSVKEAVVRVIFLTDAERPDSLATTALYAAHLKQFYAQKTAQGQQSLVNTIALCLNNSGSITPSADLKELLWKDDEGNDGWEHLDVLILTENYREDAAWIAGAMQSYLAELLLYVLLIAPPLAIKSATPTQDVANGNTTQQQSSSPDPNQQGTTSSTGTPSGRKISFPRNATFLIGMAAMEHSARWGRRLLNYKIVEQCIEVIQQETENERPRIKNSIVNWLNALRGRVKSAIPDKVPGNITALQGIARAGRAIRPIEKIFAIQYFGWNLGKETIKDLEDYRDSLASTYVASHRNAPTEFTLQDAIDSIPHIQQRLREWESKDPALRRGTPLVDAQLEAQRVLSNPDFFTGANGAVTRARIQLEELNNATSKFRNEHEQNPIDLAGRCKQLVESGTKRIEALQVHINNVPFLAKFKGLLSWITFLLILFMSIVCTFLGVAWLRHAIGTALPILTSAGNNIPLFLALVLCIPVLAITAYIARRLLSSERTAWMAEIVFFVTLFVFAIMGVIITGSSLSNLANDPASLSIISWLSFMSPLGIAIFAVLLIGVAGEIWYITWWYNHLKRERNEIAKFLEEEHRKNINDVSGYIADTITIHLLMRAKLVDDKEGPSEYFQRVTQLNRRLRDILEDAQEEQRIARKRLTLSASETQLGMNAGPSGRWLNMRIRDELLDMDALAEGYDRLVGGLDQEKVELKMLAEMLLRVMGEESSSEIETSFRESFTPQGPLDQHNAQILMTILVAMTLRISFNATLLHRVSPLLQQYDGIADNLTYQPTAMQSLVDNLRRKMRQDLLQPITGKNTKATETEDLQLATKAVAAWGQTLWEGRDQEISRTLSSEGVLPKLLEGESDVHMVKRLLGLRTSLFGRNFRSGEIVALYLLIPYSSLAHQFSQDLNIQRRHIIHFPDVERLVLLYAQPYAGEDLVIPNPSQLPAPTVAGSGNPQQPATTPMSAVTNPPS